MFQKDDMELLMRRMQEVNQAYLDKIFMERMESEIRHAIKAELEKTFKQLIEILK